MITEEMMAAAVAEMNEAMLRSLPEPEDCYHEFSAKFEKKMKRVIYRADHPLQFRILQKVASFILVLFLGFATIMAISPTVRASVFGWIREQYESFMTYYYQNSSDSGIRKNEYYIKGLEDEYELIESSADDGKYFHIYKNSNGEVLYFMYSIKYSSETVYVEHSNYTLENALVNSQQADLYIAMDDTKSSCIIWSNDEDSIIFYISAHASPDELISFACNTIPKK